MIEFCCCNLKLRSFYLLMIFISFLFYGFPVSMAIASGTGLLFGPGIWIVTLLLLFFILLVISYYWVLSIVAFLHFVINDKANTEFPVFYAGNMYWFTFFFAGVNLIYTIIILFEAIRKKDSEIIVIAVLHFFISTGVLVCMYFWSSRLREEIAKSRELTEQKAPLDEESETPNETGGKVAV